MPTAPNDHLFDSMGRYRRENFVAPAHVTRVTTSRNDHGYPYNGVCSCGWTSWGYVRDHAAQTMVAAHLAGEV